MNQNENEYLTDRIFKFVYECAMRDAIQQRAFLGPKNWIIKVTEAQEPLREYMDKILNDEFKSVEEHDCFFLRTAKTICASINNYGSKPEGVKDTFSFGNAQKLINMTAKYIYITCYSEPKLRTNFRYCHCPVDTNMLNTVWKNYKEQKGSEARNAVLGSNTQFCDSWGDEGLNDAGNQPELESFPVRYQTFQKAVKELIGTDDIYPIEYDYLYWKN